MGLQDIVICIETRDWVDRREPREVELCSEEEE